MDGRDVTSNASPSAGNLFTGSCIDVVGGYFASGFAEDDPVYACFGFNRELPASEIAQISLNPWQIFTAPKSVVVAAAASGLPTLSAPTFAPGSLTSSGWIPQVTAT